MKKLVFGLVIGIFAFFGVLGVGSGAAMIYACRGHPLANLHQSVQPGERWETVERRFEEYVGDHDSPDELTPGFGPFIL